MKNFIDNYGILISLTSWIFGIVLLITIIGACNLCLNQRDDDALDDDDSDHPYMYFFHKL